VSPEPAAVGKLLSLNVGPAREVPWEGKVVRTAIWKTPVTGARMVRWINIDGDDGPEVTFSRSSVTANWDPSYGNLLEFAEACDVPVNFGCRNGVCHLCESGVLTGDTEYVIEPLEAPNAEHVLMCCAAPASEVTLEL
jgi:ferredoxin